MSSTLSASWTLPIPREPRSKVGNPGRSRPTSSFRIFGKLEVKQRRSAHYHPTVWETRHIESLATPYTYELHAVEVEELKRIARLSLETTKDPHVLLNLVDSVERLGVAYHFEDEIREAVHLVYRDGTIDDDLYTTALRFRVLRQHGFSVGTDVFNRFVGEDGRLLDSISGDADLEGILSLYEASHLGMPGEDMLEKAKNFTRKQLKYYSSGLMASHLAKKMEQSLEVPLHWSVPRVGARSFLDLHQLDEAKSSTLLELAKLDYNLVQSVYQNELKELARWWRELGFKESLNFARDRLMENYLWTMGIIFEPRFSKCRMSLTKFVCILTVIDDIYDVYGLPDELEAFTNAVERWDIGAMMDLPVYMKICYLAMINYGNELIYDVLKSHGLDVSSYIKEAWLNLCRSYLVEARWFYNGYTPTLDEYLGNASTSVGGPAAIVHVCIFLLGSTISKTSLENCFNNGSKLILWSSLITRLSDDLGTSKDESKRGDVTKSVECYMAESGVSEEEARDHIRELIGHSWKMLNKEMVMSISNKSLPYAMVRTCLNMARTSQCIFQHGDGIGISTGFTRERLECLIVKPVPFQKNLVRAE